MIDFKKHHGALITGEPNKALERTCAPCHDMLNRPHRGLWEVVENPKAHRTYLEEKSKEDT